MDGPYGGIVELLALTGQRREEVAQMKWNELDLVQRVLDASQITDKRMPRSTLSTCLRSQWLYSSEQT
jgi:integrase